MGIVTGLVVYAIVWFMSLFLTLPFFVRTQGDEGEAARGTSQSAPASSFNLRRNLLINTAIATLIWAVIAGIILSGRVSIEDINLFALFGMGDSTALTPLQGLLSGIGHPLLGPDHLLFLLAIAFIGLQRPRAWVIPLLAAGLGGSVLSQFIPLPDAVAPWAEAMVSLSLVMEGLMALTVASTRWLLPLVALHGFLLGSTIVGAEPTPLFTYFLGLLIGQGALLLVVSNWSKSLVERLGSQGQRLGAGIWMGIGMAFAWVALID